MSHRSPEYSRVHQDAVRLFKKLLGVPGNFQLLFLGGGATLQFSMVPLNLLHPNKSCDLVLSGKVKMAPFVKTFPLAEINSVFEKVHQKKIVQRAIMVP